MIPFPKFFLTILVGLLFLSSCSTDQNKTNRLNPKPELVSQPYNDSSYNILHQQAMKFSGANSVVAEHYRDLFQWQIQQEADQWLNDHLMIQCLYWSQGSEESIHQLYEYSESIHLDHKRTMAARAAEQWIANQSDSETLSSKASLNIPADQPDIYTVIKDLESKLISSMKDSIQLKPKVAQDYVFLIQLAAMVGSDWKEGGLYLNRAAGILRNYGKWQLADHLYDWVLRLYEHDDASANALFYKAFMYDELNDDERAKSFYGKFLEDYPKHELSQQAKILYQNVGKSDQEILEEILRKGNLKNE
jgi:hypothetical protein